MWWCEREREGRERERERGTHPTLFSQASPYVSTLLSAQTRAMSVKQYADSVPSAVVSAAAGISACGMRGGGIRERREKGAVLHAMLPSPLLYSTLPTHERT